jgi:hypothetical protein
MVRAWVVWIPNCQVMHPTNPARLGVAACQILESMREFWDKWHGANIVKQHAVNTAQGCAQISGKLCSSGVAAQGNQRIRNLKVATLKAGKTHVVPFAPQKTDLFSYNTFDASKNGGGCVVDDGNFQGGNFWVGVIRTMHLRFSACNAAGKCLTIPILFLAARVAQR